MLTQGGFARLPGLGQAVSEFELLPLAGPSVGEAEQHVE